MLSPLSPMKHKFTQPCCVIVFLLCLIAVSKTSARPLDTIKSSGVYLNDDQKLHDEIMNRVSLLKSQDNDSADDLMGVETCKQGDEECFQRRIMAEAHLDYIYTQHHKP